MAVMVVEPFPGLVLLAIGLALGWQAANWRAGATLRASARSLGSELQTIDRAVRREAACLLRKRPTDCLRVEDRGAGDRLRAIDGEIELLRRLQAIYDGGTDAGWLRDAWCQVPGVEWDAFQQRCVVDPRPRGRPDSNRGMTWLER
jgi:hypothetical protein